MEVELELVEMENGYTDGELESEGGGDKQEEQE